MVVISVKMETNQTTKPIESQEEKALENGTKTEVPNITPQSDRDELGRFNGTVAGPGRPPGSKSFTTKVRDALEKIGEGNDITYEEALIKKILHKAIVQGNDKMIELLWNYMDGKPIQQLQHRGDIFMTNMTAEERLKLETILYGQPQPTTEPAKPAKQPDQPAQAEPSAREVPNAPADDGAKQGSDGAGNEWHKGTEELSV